MAKRILVVTSCTGEKLHKPENKLTIDDFEDINVLKKRQHELSTYCATAGKMYTGKQHLALMKGISEYRSRGGDIDVDILSAGFGMLKENDMIVPYEVTFNTMNSIKLKSWVKSIPVTDKLQQRIAEYDLIFFLLGDKYLQAVEWPLITRKDQKLIFFAGESSKHRILIQPNHYMFAVREQEAKAFRSGLVEIKGFLFARLLEYISERKELWNDIYVNPSLVKDFIFESITKNSQTSLFNNTNNENLELLPYYTIEIPENLIAPNYGEDFKYYIPENDDRVDPEYDFLSDQTNRTGDPLEHDHYAHQLHGTPQYDGILISKTTIDASSRKKRDKIYEMGIRKFLRLPKDYPIMGDCGAFTYLHAKEPPYTSEQVLDYYHSLGYDYGVSVDHLIVGPYMTDKKERIRRYQLTLDNARDFIEKYNEGKNKLHYTFTPIGVAQGWDPISFRNAVNELISMGYQYVALGGLAREKSYDIFEILKEISPIIPNRDFKIHLFGVVRDTMEYMKAYHKLGVTSFDSASPLRRAWLGSEHNYYASATKYYEECSLTYTKYYAAIRIPEATATSPRVKKQIREYLGSLYFKSKNNYRILTDFASFLKKQEKKERHLEETSVEHFITEFNNGKNNVIPVLQNVFDINENSDLYHTVKTLTIYYNKYLKLEEFVLKMLKYYDKGQENAQSCVEQILKTVEVIGIKNMGAEKYKQVFDLFNLFKELERKSLESLRLYDADELDIETTLSEVLKYDEMLGEDREKHAVYYREVLVDKPWKKCDCNICKKIGVEVVVFRGNNRNRRRGFHNTHVFYRNICRLREEIVCELNGKKEKCQ